MKSNEDSGKNTKDLIVYFVLAYVISWSIAIPLALEKQGMIRPILPYWTHYFVAYGPMLSALVITGVREGYGGIKELVQRIFKWNVRPIWWVAALSPLILGLPAGLILNLVMPGRITLSSLGEVNFLPNIGMGALALWIFTFGFGEETGWRGFALPRLQKNRSALSATFILTILWALWHLPAFFYLFDPAIAIGWAIGLFAGAIVFTWLLNSSQGSILMVAIFHGCFNFITASDAGNGILAAVVSTVVMVWAALIIVLFKPQKLSNEEKATVATVAAN